MMDDKQLEVIDTHIDNWSNDIKKAFHSLISNYQQSESKREILEAIICALLIREGTSRIEINQDELDGSVGTLFRVSKDGEDKVVIELIESKGDVM